MFFNLFTIIILCIQANKVNTNIFETTNHSIRSTMRVIKICERQNMALFKKKIIVSSSYDFSSSHATVFLNSSMRETNRCETHEDYRQWCNLFNNTMYLDWSYVSVVRHWHCQSTAIHFIRLVVTKFPMIHRWHHVSPIFNQRT